MYNFYKDSRTFSSITIHDKYPFPDNAGPLTSTGVPAIAALVLGLSILLLILGCVTSLLNITPLRTWESSIVPPGIFSTLAYLG